MATLVVQVALAGSSGNGGPQATASAKLGKKFKQLNKKINNLQAQLEAVSKQVGPQGSPGPQGPTGSPGPPGQKGDKGDPGSLDAWGLAGNAGTNPATQFLGTTDNQPLNLRVNDVPALRLTPASNGVVQSPNLIGGIADNVVTAGVHSATIAGGGRTNPGVPETANRVDDNGGSIGGGGNNRAGDGAGTLFDARFATVAGGDSNDAGAIWTTVGGGHLNSASLQGATVGGGDGNAASGQDATVGGGFQNMASGHRATIGGGFQNTAGGLAATVGGGATNIASGMQSTIPGGQQNAAQGGQSFAAGFRAKADHNGTFVWGDSQNAEIHSGAQNQFVARAQPGFFLTSNSTLPEDQGLINTSAGAMPDGTDGAYLSDAGAWTDVSDEDAKQAFAAIEPREVLDKVAGLPVRSWSYKAEPGVRHLGPVAQDFRRAFGLGADDRHIASLDTSGVALAAIKGLDAEMEALRSGGGAPGAGDEALPLAALLALGALGLLLAAGLGSAITLRMQGALRGRQAL